MSYNHPSLSVCRNVFALFIGSLVSLGAMAAEKSLVLHYDFDEGRGSVVHDKSGTKNDGTLKPPRLEAVWVTGKTGSALSFDGVNDSVDCGNTASAQIEAALTIGVWIKPRSESAARAQQYVITHLGWSIRLSKGDEPKTFIPYFETSTDYATGVWDSLGGNPVPVDQWSFVAVVADPDKQVKEIYLNGELSNSKPWTTGRMDAVKASSLALGCYRQTDAHFYSGLLDEVTIHARALSAAEIKGLHQQGLKKIDQGLVPAEATDQSRLETMGSKEEYVGLKRKPDSRPFAAVPAKLALANQSLRCEFSPQAGNVLRVSFAKGNRVVVDQNADTYLYDGTPISEKQDKVLGVRRTLTGEGFELSCSNPGLPDVEITKAYTLEPDRLAKTVYFRGTSEKNNGKLLFLRSSLHLADPFYKRGYFYRPIWDGGGVAGQGVLPFTPEEKITAPKINKDSFGSLSIFVQPSMDLGLAHYKYKVNGYYDSFQASARQSDLINDRLEIRPGGWDMYMTGDVMRPGDFLSCESHFMIFEGDAREYHRHEMNLPEYAALVQSKFPDWYKKVKGIAHAQLVAYESGGYLTAERIRNITSTFGPDEYLMFLVTDWAITGDYTTNGKIIGSDAAGNWKHETTAAGVKQTLEKIRSIAPDKLKLGLYTWYGSVSDKSKTYMEEHPDWLLRTQNGDLMSYSSSEVYNYLISNVTREQREFKINQYRDQVKYYQTDFTYVDGGHGELINFLPDKKFVHFYHAIQFLNGLKRAAEETDRIHFSNGSACPFLGHGGYFELGMPFHILDKVDWRILANAFYVTKYYRPNGQLGSVLHQATQGVSNRNIMYGLMPCLSTPWYWNNLSHLFLTDDLSFEVKDSEAVDGDVLHPNWWRFETETLESALLKKDKTYLLPLISHAEADKTETVKVSLDALNWSTDKPTFLWRLQPLIDSGLDHTARIPEAVDTVSADFEVWPTGKNNLKFETVLNPNRLKMITFSQVPAFVYSVNGRRNNFYLTSTQGVTIDGTSNPREVSLQVRSDASVAAEILVVLPPGWKATSTTVNGKPVATELLRLDKQLFAKLAVPKGESKVVLTPQTKAGQPAQVLVPPQRNSYADFALGWYGISGTPQIKATRKDGVPCWQLTGPGILYNAFDSGDFMKNTSGVAFRLHAGTAKEGFKVETGFRTELFSKTVPLGFTGWKDYSIGKDEFDRTTTQPWGHSPYYFLVVPEGTVYLSDFRFLPRAAGEEQAVVKPSKSIEIPMVQAPPKIDGEFNDAVWQTATTVTFGPDSGKSTVRLNYDSQNLYVAAKFEEPIMVVPAKRQRDDSSICTAPNFELYLTPEAGKSCYQLCTNPGASQWDGVYRRPDVPIEERDWDGKWTVASSSGYGVSWQVEIVIPFSDLGVEPPQPGKTWSMGLFRQGGVAGLSGWIYGGGKFHQPDNFGEITFSGKPAQ